MGGGIKYRIYKDGNGKGIFYAGTVHVAMLMSQKLQIMKTIKNVPFTFTPGGEIGYRWAFDSGFTLAPTIGAGYTVDAIEVSDYIETVFSRGFLFSEGGFFWSLGIGLARLF